MSNMTTRVIFTIYAALHLFRHLFYSPTPSPKSLRDKLDQLAMANSRNRGLLHSLIVALSRQSFCEPPDWLPNSELQQLVFAFQGRQF
jgi:hypothetical protein